jgi:hypothetical protein
MIKVQTSDGKTLFVDLKDDRQAREFLARFGNEESQRQITGVTVTKRCAGRYYCPTCHRTSRPHCPRCGSANSHCSMGTQLTLSRPESFSKTYYAVERIPPSENGKVKGGEKVTCFVDDFRIEIMSHSEQPAARVTLARTGVQRYNPLADYTPTFEDEP